MKFRIYDCGKKELKKGATSSTYKVWRSIYVSIFGVRLND